MPHTLDAVVYDPEARKVVMVVSPDDDAQLDDPSFNPPGMMQLRVPCSITDDKRQAALDLSLLPLDFLKRVAVGA